MRSRRIGSLLACAVVATACGARAPRAERGPATAPSLDSLVVDRSPCFGACPVHQLVVRRDGTVTLRPQGQPERSSAVSASTARAVLEQATAAGLWTLPERIRDDPTLCPVPATDHATVSLAGFAAGATRRVVHYTGCYASANPLAVADALLPLLALEARLQAVADSVARIPRRRQSAG